MARTALVTGASSGIGRATCQKLLGSGYKVIGVARNPAKGPAEHPSFIPWPLDLSQLDPLPARLKHLGDQHPDIDALVLAAGRGHFGHLEQFSPGQIRQLIDLDLTAQLLCARAFLPRLKGAQGGDIVFVGSEAALQGQRQGAVYCAAKFALRGFAQALRQECAGAGVRVGIVNPGMVQTPFFDQLDFAPGTEPDQHILPEDVAAAVAAMLAARPGTVLDEINLSPQKKVINFKKKKTEN